jgi:hypothetical protein
MPLIRRCEATLQIENMVYRCICDEGHTCPHRNNAPRDDDAGRLVLLWEGDENYESLDEWEDRLPPSVDDLGVSFRARHKCKMIAELKPLAEGRKVWIGELLERDPVHSIETHCLHIITPENDVVFGVYSGDAGFLAVIAQILHGGPINPQWIDSFEAYSRHNAGREANSQ